MSLNTFRNNLFELEHAAEVLRDLERFIIIEGQKTENLVNFNRVEATLSPWGHWLHRFHPLLSPNGQKQLYNAKAFPRKRMINKKADSSKFLHVTHSKRHHNRGWPGPVDMPSLFGEVCEQIFDPPCLSFPWAIHNRLLWLGNLEDKCEASYNYGKAYPGRGRWSGSYSRASSRRPVELDESQEWPIMGTP